MAFWVALRKELWEQWRSYRLLIAAVVLGAFGLSSPLLAKVTPDIIRLLPNGDQLAGLIPPATALDAVDQYLKNMSQFAIVLGILLTMGSVAQEKERGTAAMMLVKPLPRWAFLTAKFAALAVVFAVSLALAGLGAYYYTSLLFEPLDPGRWAALNGLLLVLVLVYVALTLLCSVIARSQAAAGGLALGLLILLNLPGAIPQVGRYLPGALVSGGASLMRGGEPELGLPLAVGAGLIAAALILAWRIFQTQEL
jgi:ABC-2 type transport system permease protein